MPMGLSTSRRWIALAAALPLTLTTPAMGDGSQREGGAVISHCGSPGRWERTGGHFTVSQPAYFQPGNQPCQSCVDPANAASAACVVFRELPTCPDDGFCRQQAGPFWMMPLRQQGVVAVLDRRQGANSCHLVLFASEPVIGVEDRSRRDQRPYWNLAIALAQDLRQPPLPDQDWLIGINPMRQRTQHQLHLHVGRITPVLRKSVMAAGQSSGFQSMTINVSDAANRPIQPVQIRVGWISDEPGDDPLEQRSPFARVSADAGEAAMPNAAILLTRAGGGAGYHLIYSLDDISAEGLIDFSGTCELRRPAGGVSATSGSPRRVQ